MVRHLGIEADDVLALSEQTDLCVTCGGGGAASL
jgi:hypothetical protein